MAEEILRLRKVRAPDEPDRPQSVRRIGDMDPHDFAEVIRQDDGDIILVVRGKEISGETVRVSVEFCASGGCGGRSKHTRAALLALMDAMVKDNEERPIT